MGVADKGFGCGTGVPVTDAEAGLVPAEFVAVAEQLYAVLLVSPLTKSALLAPEAVFASLPAVQVIVLGANRGAAVRGRGRIKILKDFYQTGRLFRSSERPAPSQEALMIRRRHLRPHKRQVH